MPQLDSSSTNELLATTEGASPESSRTPKCAVHRTPCTATVGHRHPACRSCCRPEVDWGSALLRLRPECNGRRINAINQTALSVWQFRSLISSAAGSQADAVSKCGFGQSDRQSNHLHSRLSLRGSPARHDLSGRFHVQGRFRGKSTLVTGPHSSVSAQRQVTAYWSIPFASPFQAGSVFSTVSRYALISGGVFS